MNISSYNKSKTKSEKTVKIPTVLRLIKNGYYKDLVEPLRVLLSQNKIKQYKIEKAKTLPSVTFSGIFEPKQRAIITLQEHSGFICLDIDVIDTSLEEYRTRVQDDPYTYACFLSPSGKGLKVLVKIPPHQNDEGHKMSYFALEDYYWSGYGIKIDDACKDVSRLCFVSFDPELYINENSEVHEFLMEKSETPQPTKKPNPIGFKLNNDVIKRSVEHKINVAKNMIATAVDGEKHTKLFKASLLIGGLVGGGHITEQEGFSILEYEISQKSNVASLDHARKTIKDGIKKGSEKPFTHDTFEQDYNDWKTRNNIGLTPKTYQEIPQPQQPKKDISDYRPLKNFFPDKLANDLMDISEAMDFRPNLLYLGALCAISSQMGLNYRIELENGWLQYGSLFCAGVGDASIGKSPTFQFAFKPVQHVQKLEEKRHAEELEKYKNSEFENSKKPKKDQERLEKPKKKTYISNDVTIESVAQVLENNPKGLLVFVDEIAGWVSSFSKYSKGGGGADSKKWLSIWSNDYIGTNRVTRDDIYLDNTFVTVVGGIQPKVLDAMAQGGLDVDGFLFRFLFEFGFKDTPAKWQQMKAAKLKIQGKDKYYYSIINKLSEVAYQDEPKTLKVSSGADKVWEKFFDETENQLAENRKRNDDVMNSILGKMSIYCSRFALIAEVLAWACGESDLSCISEKSMRKAVALAHYYTNNSVKALKVIEEAKTERAEGKPASTSQADWRLLFKDKTTLTTAEIVDGIMANYGKSEITAKRWIKAELTNVAHGVWSYKKNSKNEA